MSVEEVRREKAKALRYRKAVVKDMYYEKIVDELSEIAEECSEVQWFVDSEDGEETLLSAMDGDESEAFEFRMAFSSLSADVERMQETINGGWSETGIEEDDFNDFFAAIHASVDGSNGMAGYDEYEQDYFDLHSYESEAAIKEAQKRLMRLKKEEIIDRAQLCFNIGIQFIALRTRYDDLKAALDILRGENVTFLQQVQAIEAAYDQATQGEYEFERDSKQFDEMLKELPDRVWIE